MYFDSNLFIIINLICVILEVTLCLTMNSNVKIVKK